MSKKCPVCGNTKKFICDVVGVARYDAESNRFSDIDDLDLNSEDGCARCLECKHQAPIDVFDSGEA